MSHFDPDDFKQLQETNRLAMVMLKKKAKTFIAKQKADEEFKRASRRRDLYAKLSLLHRQGILTPARALLIMSVWLINEGKSWR